MDQATFQKKVKRFSAVGTALAVIMVLYYVYEVYWLLRNPSYAFSWEAPYLVGLWLNNVILMGVAIAIIVLAFRMLWSVTREETPFTRRNVKRLRAIGWLLLVYEPVQMLLSWLSHAVMQSYILRSGTGETALIRTHISLGGLLMVVGLAVLCLSAVFAYGCELQRQSDETL